MAKVTKPCDWCGSAFMAEVGAINRATARGARMFCGKECAGLARRSAASSKDKVKAKAAYDKEYKRKNREALKAKRHQYHVETYDPKKAAIQRKKRSSQHVEYCRRPQYKEWKKGYDREYRAKKMYGDFAECSLLAMDIREECLNQQSDYEIRLASGTLNKRQQRREEYDRTNSSKSEECALGDIAGREIWGNATIRS